MSVELKMELEGPSTRIYFVVENGKSRTQEFLEDLESKNLDHAVELFEEFADISERGPGKDPRKFKSEGKGIYAIKIPRGSVASLLLLLERPWHCDNAWHYQKRSKADPKDLQLALRLKNAFEEDRKKH